MSTELAEFLQKQKVNIFGSIILKKIRRDFEKAAHPMENAIRVADEIKRNYEANQQSASSSTSSPLEH